MKVILETVDGSIRKSKAKLLPICETVKIGKFPVFKSGPTNARPYINEGEIYELIGDKENAIANYLAATYLFVKHKFYKEAAEYGNRVLRLDPDNAEAKELLDQIP